MALKRFFDLLLVIVTAPLWLLLTGIIAVFVRLDSAGPVFFRQPRVGKNGKIFKMYKFRTMVENADALGPSITAHNDSRVTQIGVLLRWMKIDEVPQFINVLKGEMSIVGPRPEIPSIVEKYSEEQRKVLDVLPGIIGFSQIKNRDEEAMMEGQADPEKFYVEQIMPEKLKGDLSYIRSKDPFKDVRILFGSAGMMLMTSIKFRYIFESKRRMTFLFFDIALCMLSFYVAMLMRFEGQIPASEMQLTFSIIPVVAIVRAPFFVYFGLYQTLWQYLGIQELFSIIKATVASSVFFAFISFLLQMDFPPRSIILIDTLLLTMMLGASRVGFKVSAERLKKTLLGGGSVNRKNVLIIGAEDTGEFLVREFIKNSALGYRPVGFLDDDPQKWDLRIHGVKVVGKTSQLEEAVKIKKAEEVIVALAKADSRHMREIIKKCQDLNLPCRIVPTVSSLFSPQTLHLKLRPADVSDLLGRELLTADIEGIQNFLKGKRVLVTGAGGSIGSELCKVIAQNHPEELILVDNSESSLYDVEMELIAKPGGPPVINYLISAANEKEMRKIFERHKPQIIYHAAAYKHVPLMEIHYAEGITNNVLGTKNVADLASEFGIECFVLISTDKAIRPTSIMGATKRVCELYSQSLRGKKTRFLAVRFGNVFNSKGSVVPLFRKQIEMGGPVTVTDPDVTRYFMDISEAVYLILQASILGKDSEIFVLDMGTPVKIADLARDLIKLMGIPPERMQIKFTGLRPGEKLEEELELGSETAVPTSHQKIKIWKPQRENSGDVRKEIQDLIHAVQHGATRDKVIRQLKEIVPEYNPWNPQF